MLSTRYQIHSIFDEIDARWSFQSSINPSFLWCLQRPWRFSGNYCRERMLLALSDKIEKEQPMLCAGDMWQEKLCQSNSFVGGAMRTVTTFRRPRTTKLWAKRAS